MMATVDVVDVHKRKVGSVELRDAVFGAKPAASLVHEAVIMQQACERQGSASTLRRSEVSGSGKKPWKQKHTGRARSGSIRSPIWRHGGSVFGPKPRSHAVDMPKKVRALALRHALSAKAKAGEIMVLDKASSNGKTGALKTQFAKLDLSNALIIDGAELEAAFARAARNIPNIDVLPVQGINVYDILRRKKLVLTKAAIAALEARFK
mgnify:CR=1 FL=1